MHSDFIHYRHDLTARARELRRDMTDQERRLWYGWLRKLPFRFQRQKPIGNYIADFYCHKAKLVVEIDGWRHFTEDGLDYDEKRTAYFETRGLKVVRYRGAAVDADIEAVARQIEEMARTRIAELER
jgi:very-short-patch-repair endonuclease